MLTIEPAKAEGKAGLHTVDVADGKAMPWPDATVRRCEVWIPATDEDVHVRFGSSDTDAGRPVLTFRDRVLTHGAITAGGDGAWNVGNYLRGITSTGVGRILEVVSATEVRVSMNDAVPEFQNSEVVNETTTGEVGGDTGDVATLAASDAVLDLRDNLADGIIPANGEPHTVFNPDTSNNTHLLGRVQTGTSDVAIFPIGPSSTE